MKYELFSHGADIGIRGIGENLEEAFKMAGLALTAIVSNPEKVSPLLSFEIKLEEKDPELLFMDWINSLIFEMDTRKLLISDIQLSIKAGQLNALIKGEIVDRAKHDPAVEVKGATFTELKVMKENSQWICQCVVDV